MEKDYAMLRAISEQAWEIEKRLHLIRDVDDSSSKDIRSRSIAREVEWRITMIENEDPISRKQRLEKLKRKSYVRLEKENRRESFTTSNGAKKPFREQHRLMSEKTDKEMSILQNIHGNTQVKQDIYSNHVENISNRIRTKEKISSAHRSRQKEATIQKENNSDLGNNRYMPVRQPVITKRKKPTNVRINILLELAIVQSYSQVYI